MYPEKDSFNCRGYKLTEQRQRIIDVLKSEKRHLNARDIYSALHQRQPSVSLATVYRTLAILTKLNLVKKVNVAYKPSVFEFDGRSEKAGELEDRVEKLH